MQAGLGVASGLPATIEFGSFHYRARDCPPPNLPFSSPPRSATIAALTAISPTAGAARRRFSGMQRPTSPVEAESLLDTGGQGVLVSDQKPSPPTSLLTRLTACLQYGAVSTSITLFNRAVFSVYSFNFPAFVTLVQILVSIVFIYGLQGLGYLEVAGLSVAGARKVSHQRRGGRRQRGAGQ